MLVSDLYYDSLVFQESSLAHCIHLLLEEKKISLEDDASKLDFSQIDSQKLADMIEQNVLSIHKVGIYSLKMGKRTFVFIFAESQEEAVQFFKRSFHHPPLNCHEYPLEFELTRGNEVISFRDMKREFERFPAIAGYFMRGQ